MSMVLVPMACTRGIMTSNSSASRYTTMRSVPTSTFLVLSWLISSPGQWTPSDPALLVTFSGLTILSLVKVVLVTTGRKDVRIHSILSVAMLMKFIDYTEGAELVDSVLDVVRKEAEGTDCLQGKLC